GMVDVASAPGFAYALATDALHVLDTATPEAPLEKGAFAPAGASFVALDVNGSLAAIADDAMVRMVSLASPASPVQVGTAALPGFAVRVQLAGNLLYALHESGLT